MVLISTLAYLSHLSSVLGPRQPCLQGAPPQIPSVMKYARKVVRAKILLTESHTENHFLGQSGEYERITSLATVGAQIVGLGQTRVFWISTGAIFLVY